VPLKSYLTMEHDKNEVFIHNPHLAAYYGNKLNYILSRTEEARVSPAASAGGIRVGRDLTGGVRARPRRNT